MNRKNVQNITLKSSTQKTVEPYKFETAEGIDIKSQYTKDDIKNLQHLKFLSWNCSKSSWTIQYNVC